MNSRPRFLYLSSLSERMSRQVILPVFPLLRSRGGIEAGLSWRSEYGAAFRFASAKLEISTSQMFHGKAICLAITCMTAGFLEEQM
jgi:hypothetical protein